LNTKSCPSCGADVPTVAKRCRECFHDFRPDTEPKPGSNVLLMLLGFLGVMAVLGALTLGTITSFPLDQKVQVAGETKYIIVTTQYVSGLRTERVPFAKVREIEHIIVGNGTFEVLAHLDDGGSLLLTRSKKSRKGDAEAYAAVMDKPFRETDNTTGFFKQAQQAQQSP
jgi:ribosomal protein L40E